jgi:hypothetical protein
MDNETLQYISDILKNIQINLLSSEYRESITVILAVGKLEHVLDVIAETQKENEE